MLGMGSGALNGRVRVEFEGPVGDRDLARMAKGGNRAFEPALAEVTPRAHDVRPDLDIHGSSNLPEDGVIPPRTPDRIRPVTTRSLARGLRDAGCDLYGARGGPVLAAWVEG